MWRAGQSPGDTGGGGGGGYPANGAVGWEGAWEEKGRGVSFSFSQDDVDESADQRQRKRHPGQVVGEAEGGGLWYPLWTHQRVDDGRTHHKQAGKDLEGSGKEEAAALLQGEELAEEQEERQEAEDDGQNHQGLNRLDPLPTRCRSTVIVVIRRSAVIP